jgi:asparagine synthase (glutamine-hydrolysing)
VSVQFGTWNFDGNPIDLDRAASVDRILAEYAPDGYESHATQSLRMTFGSFHTTGESRRQSQPYTTRSGRILLWDGRLDNRSELLHLLGHPLSEESADVAIVGAAFEAWGLRSLPKLLGDWALSIWDPEDRSLVLAKDFLGARHLYYSMRKDGVVWATLLEPLLVFSETLRLEQEYIAGWLGFFPSFLLTPYAGIHSVPPASSVIVRGGKTTVQTYWTFDPGKRIHYQNDTEYEDHFRTLLFQSVRRRLRADSPILAELSGGMDSSSIVCVADYVLARGQAEAPRLDTLSYYDDSEPHWNERPYLAKVEEKRGRTGFHISAEHQGLALEYDLDHFVASPGSHRSGKNRQLLAGCLRSQGNRVLLSGTGGDEVLGGVPSPVPELADLLAGCQFRKFLRQMVCWALAKRVPIFSLIAQTVGGFLPSRIANFDKQKRPAEWIAEAFAKQHKTALGGYETRLRLFGPRPSFQENLTTLDVLRRQLSCTCLSLLPCYEKRYPYLDRDLLEFIYAIPREQVLRPDQRRSLQRRALVGIVPAEILNRRRKAFVTRGPMVAIAAAQDTLVRMCRQMVADSIGIVNSRLFLEVLERACKGQEIPVVPVLRTLALESWLRQAKDWGILDASSRGGYLHHSLFSRSEAIS